MIEGEGLRVVGRGWWVDGGGMRPGDGGLRDAGWWLGVGGRGYRLRVEGWWWRV